MIARPWHLTQATPSFLDAVAALHQAAWTARIDDDAGHDPRPPKWPPNASKAWRRPVNPAGTPAPNRKVQKHGMPNRQATCRPYREIIPNRP